MNKMMSFAISLLIGSLLILAGVSDAEAKRFGGGRSFGGKSSYSSPFRRSAIPKSPTQRKAASKNQSMRQSMSKRGGLMGMLGGLALGGLLGSLLFGGAFENMNFFDIAILGLIAYMIYKFFGRKREITSASYHTGGSASDSRQEHGRDHAMERQTTTAPAAANRRPAANFDTDVLFKKGSPVPEVSKHQFNDYSELPEDFDENTFLDGAKAAYRRLQVAWDSGDLADIRSLTSDKVFAELQDQSKIQKGINVTDIIKVDAELLLVNDTGTQKEASVLIDAILRESPDARPEQVREIWHFIRSNNSQKPTWFLDGIQQMED
ncbi:MAG: Tim44-like domain-containing protein [Methylococcales bacterium]